ncbi:MAG TPA: hypothetical protein VFZ53_26335 [Polyangiaceae bacterium]
MCPALELSFLELEIGPPADTVDVSAKSPLFAANGAEVPLMDGVSFEQRFDPSPQGGIQRGRSGPPSERDTTPVEDTKNHGVGW